jgi:TPR repeat protein
MLILGRRMCALMALGLLMYQHQLGWGETLVEAAEQSGTQGQCNCHTEAMKWYLLGAEEGQAGAQYNLGLIYASGKGIPQDYAEAIKWYRLAAEQGHTDAQYNLGLLYANGEGIGQDLVQAYLWLELATQNGREEYVKTLAQTASTMTPTQIEEARRLADEWLANHAE